MRTPVDVLGILAVAAEQRTPAQRERLKDYYARQLAPELKSERDKLAALRKQIDGMMPVTVPMFRELAGDQRRKTKIQLRGNFLSLGDEVTEGVPAAFHPLPKDAPMNRLTLARWLVDENNPLTARVVANRFWESIFGIGIVRTSEEFGAQGDAPSHPELLDWLATELVREKWDMKKFLKLLVTSATYRQSSKVTPELVERDPDNRLLARGPRFRMGAEMVRDQALAVSGLLSRKMFGPSVRPPRPNMGLSAAFGGGLDWETSAGEDMHRRALYTEWRRTAPYPSMVTFDAPNREVCTLRRNRTNTPLQALVTMNDPVYVEAAQALARRMVAGGSTAEEKARAGFRLTLTRPPTERELRRLIALHESVLATYRQDEKKARRDGDESSRPRAERRGRRRPRRMDDRREHSAESRRNRDEALNPMNPELDLLQAQTRRHFLQRAGQFSLGSIALNALLGNNAIGSTAAVNPLAPHKPHFAPKAKRVDLPAHVGRRRRTSTFSTTSRSW